jgi:hypothetical protein
MALFATNASGQVDNHPRLIPTRWTWSGSHVGPFARCSDIGAPYRRTVALILQAQSFPQKQRRRWRRLLSGRLRRPRAGSAHHVLGLHDPGVCLMLAGESLYRGSGAARFCHLHVEAMLRSRDHPIGRINHAIRWHVSPCVAAPKRMNCYSGRCVMRLRLGTCRKTRSAAVHRSCQARSTSWDIPSRTFGRSGRDACTRTDGNARSDCLPCSPDAFTAGLGSAPAGST